MKKLIFIFFLAFSVNAFAQNEAWEPLKFNEQGKVEMVEVFDVPGKTRHQIFAEVKNWFGEHNKASSGSIEVDDIKTGVISGKSTASFSNAEMGYTIKVDVKDGRYRLSTTDYIVKNNQSGDSPVEKLFVPQAVKENGEIRPYPLSMKTGILGHFEEVKTGLNKRFVASTDDW
jgi:hypothetical protein